MARQYLGVIYDSPEDIVHSENYKEVIASKATAAGMEPAEFIDGRKGKFWRFKYCPETGGSIDWNEITNGLK